MAETNQDRMRYHNAVDEEEHISCRWLSLNLPCSVSSGSRGSTRPGINDIRGGRGQERYGEKLYQFLSFLEGWNLIRHRKVGGIKIEYAKRYKSSRSASVMNT